MDPGGETATATVSVTILGIAEPTGSGTQAGGGGNDPLIGDDGNNRMRGGAGNDLIAGGAGDDNLNGGADADTFVFDPNAGHDTITGFEDGLDVIDARGILGVQTHGEVFAFFDSTGDGIVNIADDNVFYAQGRLTLAFTADDSVTLFGVKSLAETDFNNLYDTL